MNGIRMRFETKPGKSFATAGVFPRGVPAADDLYELQDGHRVEEVHPDHLVGTPGRSSERSDGNGGRVRGEHRLHRQLDVRPAEDLLLHLGVLDHGFDHQVGPDEIVDGLDAPQHFLHRRAAFLLQLRKALPHRVQRAVRRTRLRVLERHTPPRCCDDLGDACAHLPRSHHEHVLEFHVRDPTPLRTPAPSDEEPNGRAWS
jgi:hypothetical protein